MTGANLKNSSNDEGMETGTGWEIKVWPMDGWQDGMEDDMNVCVATLEREHRIAILCLTM